MEPRESWSPVYRSSPSLEVIGWREGKRKGLQSIYLTLRYNWHITWCKFKVYNVMIWFKYILWNAYHRRLVDTSFTSHNYHFVIVRTLKLYSYSNFQLYNTVLLTIVTMLYIRSLELSHLITKFVPFDQHFHIFSTLQPLATTIPLFLRVQCF